MCTGEEQATPDQFKLARSLHTALSGLIEHYKTSVEEDQALLRASSSGLGSREEQAVIARVEYKRVVLAAKALLGQYCEWLERAMPEDISVVQASGTS